MFSGFHIMALSKWGSPTSVIINSVITASFQSEYEFGLVRILEGEKKIVVSDIMTKVITIRPFDTTIATENIAVLWLYNGDCVPHEVASLVPRCTRLVVPRLAVAQTEAIELDEVLQVKKLGVGHDTRGRGVFDWIHFVVEHAEIDATYAQNETVINEM